VNTAAIAAVFFEAFMINQKDFIPSFNQANQLNQSNQPFLFFHIPKSAGMSLVSGMVSCYDQVSNTLPYKAWYGRIDDINSQSSRSTISAVKQYIKSDNSREIGGFIGSHAPMQVLQEVPIEFRMLTVLRRTEDRVLSAFNYDCMRNNRQPTSVGLDEFISLPNQQNVSVKTLLGIKEISGGEADIAANLLSDCFYAYCFIEDMNLLVSAILSHEGLPNLQLGQENKTIDTFRYKPNSEELAKIKMLNQEDERLINILGYGSLKLPKFSTSYGMSQNVVKVMGRQTNERYGYHSKIQKLSQLQAS